MKIEELLKDLSLEQLKGLSKQELIAIVVGEQKIRKQIEDQRDQTQEDKLLLEEKYVLIKSKVFGRSSEKTPRPNNAPSGKNKEKKKRENFSKDLAGRYPNVDIKEEEIFLETPPTCNCCQSLMVDSGQTEESEYLTIIPKKFLIVRQLKHKYRCGNCHGDIKTAPGLPRLAPGSSYGDEVIMDVALSKYCDLIPIERYAMMAARQGLKGLPSNSLINVTHFLADFINPAYQKLLLEIRSSEVIQADETPHRMLEGDEKSNWYLWGFSTMKACYFEFHNTRSGDVASDFLKQSECIYLVSDVYAGYSKAVSETNKTRAEENKKLITSAYCNAHARRKFDEAKHPFSTEAQFYLDQYKEIYKLNSEAKDKNPEEILMARSQMTKFFEEMKRQSEKDLRGVSTKSSLAKAINYFLNNYDGFTLFIKNASIPIDNNSQERLLRSPVIGRKTWYGTHSIKGAKTAAVIFSLVESCKLNKVNPREYFKELVGMIHQKSEPLTPWEYLQKVKSG